MTLTRMAGTEAGGSVGMDEVPGVTAIFIRVRSFPALVVWRFNTRIDVVVVPAERCGQPRQAVRSVARMERSDSRESRVSLRSTRATADFAGHRGRQRLAGQPALGASSSSG